MDIKIKETGEDKELTIIDPKTDCEWTGDLLGNHDALEYDDDLDCHVMSQADFDWWAPVVAAYHKADWRAYELRQRLSNEDHDQLLEDLSHIDVDLEYVPAAIEAICDEYESKSEI